MRISEKIDKLGLIIFSIITLLLAIILCMIGFDWMEPTIFDVLVGKVLMSQTYTNIMIGVCIVLILLAVKCIFFSSDSDGKKDEADSGILLQNEDGKLLITVETLKNMVTGVVGEFKEILDSESGVSITKENDIIIDVTINVARNTVIKDISNKLQTEIKKVIKVATGLDIKLVNVRVKNVENEVEINKAISKKLDENEKSKEKQEEKDDEDSNQSEKKDDKDSKQSEKKATDNNQQTQNKSTKKTK